MFVYGILFGGMHPIITLIPGQTDVYPLPWSTEVSFNNYKPIN